jgi:hypothetical protein
LVDDGGELVRVHVLLLVVVVLSVDYLLTNLFIGKPEKSGSPDLSSEDQVLAWVNELTLREASLE